MHDKAFSLFKVEKHDGQYLNSLQVNKSKYWFQKFIGKLFVNELNIEHNNLNHKRCLQ